jgi:hypothetical protein
LKINKDYSKEKQNKIIVNAEYLLDEIVLTQFFDKNTKKNTTQLLYTAILSTINKITKNFN